MGCYISEDPEVDCSNPVPVVKNNISVYGSTSDTIHIGNAWVDKVHFHLQEVFIIIPQHKIARFYGNFLITLGHPSEP